MFQQHMQPIMPDADMAYTILADLKRVVGEYATATTESSCPTVRGMFTNLLNSTLKMQGDLYQAMQGQNMYSTSSPALRQSMDKEFKQYQQDIQQTNQYLQQTVGRLEQQQPYYTGTQPYGGQQPAAHPNQPYYI
ncbi:spore coat protein [Paenibacillus thailandensis]|uniref:Spore coat protein n=1 Tax=Paenibacillus thailandensis TaxID=393250 RepID=A0ABW5QTW8_9BACL